MALKLIIAEDKNNAAMKIFSFTNNISRYNLSSLDRAFNLKERVM